MPIYEYRCEDCSRITSFLVLKPEEEKELSCRHCRGSRIHRVISRCTVHKTEAQRLKEFDPCAPRGDEFYKDDRNVGLWAKKRVGELGVDLGSHMDEIVEKARTGKILDE